MGCRPGQTVAGVEAATLTGHFNFSEQQMHAILAVDNSASMRRVAALTLKHAGFSVLGWRRPGRAAGAAGWPVKPFEPAELGKVIVKVIVKVIGKVIRKFGR